MFASTKSGVEAMTVSARIIRADGTVEDLGVIAHHKSWRLRLRSARAKLFRKA